MIKMFQEKHFPVGIHEAFLLFKIPKHFEMSVSSSNSWLVKDSSILLKASQSDSYI